MTTYWAAHAWLPDGPADDVRISDLHLDDPPVLLHHPDTGHRAVVQLRVLAPVGRHVNASIARARASTPASAISAYVARASPR